ncbi:hypothetical protein [Pedobacter glucosidilyticus]|uniref:hypothetical protein n=1 Tax=Pedobacter glucosidilyticus TaxID=1122941 RepID=UPI00047BA0C2|nr:hypothetical protein [Pedobacter glucosidilyticus]
MDTIEQIAKARQLGHLMRFEVQKRPNNTDIVEGTILYAVPMCSENLYFQFTDGKPNTFIVVDDESIEVLTVNPNKRVEIEMMNAIKPNIWVVMSRQENLKVSTRRLELYKQFPHLLPSVKLKLNAN